MADLVMCTEKTAPVQNGERSAPTEPPENIERDEEAEQKERDGIRELVDSLEAVASNSAVEREREELQNLNMELALFEISLRGAEGEKSSDITQLKRLVSRLEREIAKVDTKVLLSVKLLDKDNDVLMSFEECKGVTDRTAGERDDDVIQQIFERLDADDDGNISREDLKRVLGEMQYDLGTFKESSQQKQKASSSDITRHKEARASNS